MLDPNFYHLTKEDVSIMYPDKFRVKKTVPRKRQELLRWRGWGFNDSGLRYSDEGYFYTLGSRYEVVSGKKYPNVPAVTGLLGVDALPDRVVHTVDEPTKYPEPTIQKDFVREICDLDLPYSTDGSDRLFRSHGQTAYETLALLTASSSMNRIPDFIVWPSSQEEVQKIIKAAVKYDVVIIPFGGGTNVSLALMLPQKEKRMIVSLDLSEMCHIHWIDDKNLAAKVEAGVTGQDLEEELNSRGFTLGHEPDSVELSTVGGWVATRASGMKRNGYGNIEDLIVAITAVTPKGIIEKRDPGARISAGPDVNHILLGSEGTLGVITEVTLKIRPIPEVKRYGSLAFPDFKSGVECLKEVAQRKCDITSIRLMDNKQFKAGYLLKPAGVFSKFMQHIENAYLSWVKHYDIDKMAVATLLFEGDADKVDMQEKKIYAIAKKYGAISGGSAHGERGYKLTLFIGYIRDCFINHGLVGESVETTCPWDKVLSLCVNVDKRVEKECKTHGIDFFIVSNRISQIYESGVCIYVYVLFILDPNRKDALDIFETIEESARDETIKSGGSISHHHGIGQKRKKYMKDCFSPTVIESIRNIKQHFDPSNIFANNLV